MTVDVTLHYSRLVARSTALPSVASFHALLHRGFPAAKERPFLFRADRALEPDGRFNAVTLLVQSTVRPDWSRVPELLSVVTRTHTWTLREGAVFRFLLRGNTVRDRAAPEDTAAAKATGAFRSLRKHEIAARSHDDRVAWLTERAARRGFALVGEPVTSNTVPRSASSSNGGRARLYGCDFEGHLRVLDPHAFADTLRTGVGGQRVYGYGLVSIAPPR